MKTEVKKNIDKSKPGSERQTLHVLSHTQISLSNFQISVLNMGVPIKDRELEGVNLASCSQVPAGVPWGRGKNRPRTKDAGTGNQLKQQPGFILGKSKPYISHTLPRRGSAELAFAQVMWLLSIAPSHLLSDLAAVIKVLWQTQAGFQKTPTTHAVQDGWLPGPLKLSHSTAGDRENIFKREGIVELDVEEEGGKPRLHGLH